MEIDKIKKEYGEKYQDHFLKQYELYLAAAEKISDRRENVNKYFYTLNSGIFISAGFLINSEISSFLIILILLFLSVLGVIFSIIFWYLINSYKQLNTGKFNVLHEMEKQLPSQPYKDEWEMLGEGKDKKKYFPFSHIEKIIPVIFGVIYSGGLLVFIGYILSKVFCF
ncbi:MAG: hypothetical protein KAI16_02985 [Candidatus Pacebacteria bacterium]|nr:hypothetical protein [Candidatus Paceibacterota bacterium]